LIWLGGCWNKGIGGGTEGDLYDDAAAPEEVEVGKKGVGVEVAVAVGKRGWSLVGVGGRGWKGVFVGLVSRGALIRITSAVGVSAGKFASAPFS
jgi:hypothetical protein